MTKRELFSGDDLNPNENIFQHLSRKTPADIEFLGRETIRQMIQGWRWNARQLAPKIKALSGARNISEGRRVEQLDELIRQKARVDARIKFLIALEKKAESKPIVAPARPYHWVKVGDPVICYVVPEEGFVRLRRGFMRGIVAESNGTYVVVSFPERLHNYDSLWGHGLSFFDYDPKVMSVEDYRYLIDHLDFARAWVGQAREKDKTDNAYVNRAQFLCDLAKARADL